jgi:hypothetical protein
MLLKEEGKILINFKADNHHLRFNFLSIGILFARILEVHGDATSARLASEGVHHRVHGHGVDVKHPGSIRAPLAGNCGVHFTTVVQGRNRFHLH